MSTKLGKVLDYQKMQNEAVEKMIDFLSNYYSTGMLYETLAKAQVQIMSLIRLCDQYIRDGQKWGEVLDPKDIEDMLLMVNDVYKLLKPFEELARENGGGDVL
jgi:beta-glucosidase/6-phospho-beta-glucosidase/beta-galactosidase